MQVTSTATDPLGLVDTDTATLSAPSGTSQHVVRSSFLKNRINWGNAVTEDIQGPNVTLGDYIAAPDGPVTRGISLVVLEDCKLPGMRIYKAPDEAGSIPVGLWDDAGTLLATKTVTWVADSGGWREILFDVPVDGVAGNLYHWGALHSQVDGKYAWSPYVLNAQDWCVWPFHMPSFSSTSSGVKSGGSWYRQGATLTLGNLPADRWPHNYYIDPIADRTINVPAYESGESYYDQFPNGGSRFDFPIGIYWADPPYIQGYANLGVNTYWAGSTTPDYVAAIKAAGMDWYPTLHGGDMSAPISVQEDAALATLVRGYMITDEPELNTPWNSPATLRAWRNACRRIDSTRPVNLNMSRFTMENQGFNAQPPGYSMLQYNQEFREYMSLADWGSLDCYGIAHTYPYSYQANDSKRYGIWIYPITIHRMREEITDKRMPIHGVVETTSSYANSPTTDQVKKAVWSCLIAGARGIEYFDHRFASPQVSQDFAAMLHDAPMSSMIQALNAQMISLAPALLAAEANLITAYTTTGTLAKAQGGIAQGAKIPLHYSSRVVGATKYFFVQSIRDGSAGSCTVTIPGFQGATLTVIGESRTVTVNGSGVFTDTFTGDYAYHLYSTTATPTFSAPSNSVAPVISGTVETGEVLTVSTGTWSGVPAPTFTYQWQRNGVNIVGATTGVAYTLQLADEGQSIRCVVTATNSQGSASANSNVVTPAEPSGSDYEATILADGPTALWRLKDYTDAANSHDLSVGAGTFTDAPSLITDLVDGAKGFDGGGTAYLSTADASDLRSNGDFSAELWLRLNVVGNFWVITKTSDFRVQTAGGKFRFGILGKAGWYSDVDSVTAYSLSTPYHVVGTWKNSTKIMKIYVNGVLENTLDCSSFGYAAEDAAWTQLRFGYPGVGTGLANGIIDEAAVYQFTLSDAQIAAHYAAGIA